MTLKQTSMIYVSTLTSERHQSDPAGRGQWLVNAQYQRPTASFDGGLVP